MRPRWHDWIIGLALIILGITGVWSLWGGDIQGLFHPDVRSEGRPEGRGDPAAATQPAAPAAVPAGPAQGPF